MIGCKPLRIRFDKIDGFIRICNGTMCLVLYGGEKHDFIFKRIKYLIGVKCGITYVISIYYMIKVDSYDSLPLEETLKFYNVI